MKTIIKTAFTVILFAVSISITGQDRQWASIYSGLFTESQDHSLAVVLDGDGNSYVTGYSDDHIATLKYSSNGTQQWVQNYGSGNEGDNVGYAITTFTDNNGTYIYVTGKVKSTNQGFDYVTIKYDVAGNEVWNNPAFYNGPENDDDIACDIGTDYYGNIYVTGKRHQKGENDYLTIKYNSAGQEQWIVSYDGPAGWDDYPTSLAVDNPGNVFVTGWSWGDETNYDIATVAYQSNGSPLSTWSNIGYGTGVRRYNGPSNYNDGGNDITVDPYTGVYLTGISEFPNNNNNSGTSYTVIKYDVYDGDELWVNSEFTGKGNSIALMKISCFGNTPCYSNEIYVTGQDYTTGKGLTLRLDEDGQIQSDATFSIENSEFYSIATYPAIASTSYRYVYVAGHSDNSDVLVSYDRYLQEICYDSYGDGQLNGVKVDINGDIHATGTNYDASTYNDYLTTKYILCDDGGGDFANKNQMPLKFNLSQNYPNPFNPSTEISYSVPVNTFVTLKICNSLGQAVSTLINNEYKNKGLYSIIFDGSKLASGIYFYTIQAGFYRDTKKMVLVK